MQIENINKAMVNGLGGSVAAKGNVKAGKKEAARKAPSIREKSESIIAEALKLGQINQTDVQRARMLIDSRQLDTMENVEAAVRNIIRRGI